MSESGIRSSFADARNACFVRSTPYSTGKGLREGAYQISKFEGPCYCVSDQALLAKLQVVVEAENCINNTTFSENKL